MASEYSARLEALQHPRPLTPSPATGKARSDLAKTQLRNYSSKMVSSSVNKTALHPGGVEYVVVGLSTSVTSLTMSIDLPVNTLNSKKSFTPQRTLTMTVSPLSPTPQYLHFTKTL
jgi:hypothetical protein